MVEEGPLSLTRLTQLLTPPWEIPQLNLYVYTRYGLPAAARGDHYIQEGLLKLTRTDMRTHSLFAMPSL